MSDRELLEMAAKAARIEGFRYCDHWRGMAEWYESDGGYFGGKTWNPLTDDGDALRLAVKLRIGLLLDESDDGSAHARQLWDNIDKGERYNGDRFAATRHAIVRAAAEIGKAMP